MREYVDMMYQYYEPQIVDSSAFEQAFGMRHSTSRGIERDNQLVQGSLR